MGIKQKVMPHCTGPRYMLVLELILFRTIFNIVMSEKIIDTYFGEMEVSHNKETGIYSLDKKIEIHGVREVINLHVDSDDKTSSERQQQTYDLVISNFTLIYKNILLFLTKNHQYQIEDFPRHYRLESLTLSIQTEPTYGQWLLDIIDLREGSSHIIVEMIDLNPINFQVKA
jgi:hypothetical protein